MLFVLCYLFYFATITQIFANRYVIQSKIIGGRAVQIENYPYQLAVLIDGKLTCGATLLNQNTAISAAHCYVTDNAVEIRAGSTSSVEGGVVVPVKQIVIHPAYVQATNDYDIAILHFEKSLEYSKLIKPVKLPKSSKTVSSQLVGIVSGWGITSTTNRRPEDILRAVRLPVISQEECEKVYSDLSVKVTDRMFCAGYVKKGGKDSCQGDSGGPFVVEGVLYGIVSWGYSCAKPGFPGVYTSVPLFRDYIKEIAGV